MADTYTYMQGPSGAVKIQLEQDPDVPGEFDIATVDSSSSDTTDKAVFMYGPSGAVKIRCKLISGTADKYALCVRS